MMLLSGVVENPYRMSIESVRITCDTYGRNCPGLVESSWFVSDDAAGVRQSEFFALM